MAGTTYKCPSCGAYLAFDPESQLWKCPFCDSAFPENELHANDETAETAQQPSGAQVVYRCQSCGSEIVTDETTVATRCYYCHSPVVMQGKMTDEYQPDKVLPFSISREKAVSTFMDWVKKKKYVPRNFFKEAQVESMDGVYYPHFVADCQMDCQLDGEATDTHVHDEGRFVVTDTRHFDVHTEGKITFRSIMRPALKKANRKLSDGIHPFPLEDAKPFSGAYLAGFLAERRDIAPEDIQPDVQTEVQEYVRPLLEEQFSHQSIKASVSSQMKAFRTDYVLLPTWVLTYPNKDNPEDPYYYAMNGCTGEVCGKLPLDKGRLWRKALLVGGIVFAVCCLIAYFLL